LGRTPNGKVAVHLAAEPGEPVEVDNSLLNNQFSTPTTAASLYMAPPNGYNCGRTWAFGNLMWELMGEVTGPQRRMSQLP
jgi:hypothetical protein